MANRHRNPPQPVSIFILSPVLLPVWPVKESTSIDFHVCCFTFQWHAILLYLYPVGCGELKPWLISFENRLSYSPRWPTWGGLLTHNWESKLKCQTDWLEWHHFFEETQFVLILVIAGRCDSTCTAWSVLKVRDYGYFHGCYFSMFQMCFCQTKSSVQFSSVSWSLQPCVFYHSQKLLALSFNQEADVPVLGRTFNSAWHSFIFNFCPSPLKENPK